MNAGVWNEATVRRHLLSLYDMVEFLEPHSSLDLSTYRRDRTLQLAVERALLICIQNLLDIAVHLTASAGIDSPDYRSSIDALARLGILPYDFALALRPVASFRNVLVHSYLIVDPTIVHQVLARKLPELRAFAGCIEAYLDR